MFKSLNEEPSSDEIKTQASPLIPMGRLLGSDKEVTPDQLSDEAGEGHGHAKSQKSSVLGSALNIGNTIMGAGIIGLPNVIAQFGVLLGSIILIISCFLTYLSCCLLLKAKNLSAHSKYISIGQSCFGKPGLWIVKFIIIINNFGLCIAYLIIFATVAQNLLGGFLTQCAESVEPSDLPFYCQHQMLTLFAAFLLIPFLFAKSMSSLQKVSAVAVIAALTFATVTIGSYFKVTSEGNNYQYVDFLPVIRHPTTALSSITSVFMAFTFQFNFFPVYKTLERASDSRMRKTTFIGLFTVLFVYLGVANCGYLTFGPKNAHNFLLNFTRGNLGTVIFVVINIAFLISSTLTLPMQFFGCKNEIYGMIKILRKRAADNQAKKENRPYRDEETPKQMEEKYGFKGVKFVLYILVLYTTIAAAAMFVPGISLVFDYVGSTAANGLCFFLPSLFYLKLASKRGSMRHIGRFIFGFASVMGIVAIVTSTLDLFITVNDA